MASNSTGGLLWLRPCLCKMQIAAFYQRQYFAAAEGHDNIQVLKNSGIEAIQLLIACSVMECQIATLIDSDFRMLLTVVL